MRWVSHFSRGKVLPNGDRDRFTFALEAQKLRSIQTEMGDMR
jgi:hypothetical protein